MTADKPKSDNSLFLDFGMLIGCVVAMDKMLVMPVISFA